MPDGNLIPRPDLAQIAAHRETALQHYADAHKKLCEVNEALRAAHAALQLAAPTKTSLFFGSLPEKTRLYLRLLDLPEEKTFSANARKGIDSAIWYYLAEAGDLQRVMDATAKAELRKQLATDPPEATVDSMAATLETLAAQSATIFRRGIATVFSNLDRRFRSHDGWAIGSRIILPSALGTFGIWRSCGFVNTRETIIDVERVLYVLDGKVPPTETDGIVGTINRGRPSYKASRYDVQTEYIRARVFQNGNLHLWFLRRDLMLRVNQLIGEYYGSPIPEERSPDYTADVLRPKAGLAKNFGFYPTPPEAAQKLISWVHLSFCWDAGPTVLEPSAGTGNLASLVAAKGGVVDCVEIQPDLAEGLRASGLYRTVTTGDFLAQTPTPTYDLVVMNPPFDHERDIDHVLHALAFVKPGGQLVAIMSAGTEYRTTKKSDAFRSIAERHDARYIPLREGSFASVGTNVNTLILSLTKPK
jgi:predicted RNA methylase